jgi:hypothetical protein
MATKWLAQAAAAASIPDGLSPSSAENDLPAALEME